MNDEPPLARVCMLLATLVNEVRGLRADLADRRAAPRTITAADAEQLDSLLPILHNVTGGARFTVHDLLLRSDATELRDTLERSGLGQNARRLGRLLRRAALADFDAGGLFVDALGRERAGTCFRVTAETRETHIARTIAQKLAS
jgi:hypothetical protein